MCYSIEPRERRYVKGYGFMSFARNVGNKYGKKLMNTAIKTGTNFNSKYSKKNPIMKKYSQMKLIMKYQKKDIFLLKKDKKLLMN